MGTGVFPPLGGEVSSLVDLAHSTAGPALLPQGHPSPAEPASGKGGEADTHLAVGQPRVCWGCLGERNRTGSRFHISLPPGCALLSGTCPALPGPSALPDPSLSPRPPGRAAASHASEWRSQPLPPSDALPSRPAKTSGPDWSRMSVGHAQSLWGPEQEPHLLAGPVCQDPRWGWRWRPWSPSSSSFLDVLLSQLGGARGSPGHPLVETGHHQRL